MTGQEPLGGQRQGSRRTSKGTDPANHIATPSGSGTGSEEPQHSARLSTTDSCPRRVPCALPRAARRASGEGLVGACTEPAGLREPSRNHRGPSSWHSPGESTRQQGGVACGPVLCSLERRLTSPRILPREGTSVEPAHPQKRPERVSGHIVRPRERTPQETEEIKSEGKEKPLPLTAWIYYCEQL